MSTILLRNILNEFDELPDDIKEKYSKSLDIIKMHVNNLINSIKNSHSLSKSISTTNLTSKSNVFSSPTPISMENQLEDIKSEMLESLKKNKNAISLNHKDMIE